MFKMVHKFNLYQKKFDDNQALRLLKHKYFLNKVLVAQAHNIFKPFAYTIRRIKQRLKWNKNC